MVLDFDSRDLSRFMTTATYMYNNNNNKTTKDVIDNTSLNKEICDEPCEILLNSYTSHVTHFILITSLDENQPRCQELLEIDELCSVCCLVEHQLVFLQMQESDCLFHCAG